MPYNVVVLNGDEFYDSSGPAEALNASGQSIGAALYTNLAEAELWSVSGNVTILQDVGGQGSSGAYGINDLGESAGSSRTPPGGVYDEPGSDAVLWSPSGAATVLQDVGGQGSSRAVAINDAGQIVGSSVDASQDLEAVLWNSSGNATVLQKVRGTYASYATAINDVGQSIGCSTGSVDDQGFIDAVLWSPSGKATKLQDVGGHGDSVPPTLSTIPAIASDIPLPRAGEDAVLWGPKKGKATVLQDVGGQGSSYAYAHQQLRAECWIFRYLDALGDRERSCGRDRIGDAVFQSLGGDSGIALAINDFGQSVGNSNTASGAQDAVLWGPKGKVTNLANILGSGWTETEATSINNAGDILGEGIYDGNIDFSPSDNVSDASSDHYNVVISHDNSAFFGVHLIQHSCADLLKST